MKIKLKDVMDRWDWFKLLILLIVSIFCWTWVYQEMQKPIIPENLLIIDTELTK